MKAVWQEAKFSHRIVLPPADAAAGILLQKRLAIAAGLGAGGLVMMYANDTTQLQFDTATATGSLLSLLDAETAHRVGIWAAKYRLVPRDSRPDPPSLATTVWGRHFVNPLGKPDPLSTSSIQPATDTVYMAIDVHVMM